MSDQCIHEMDQSECSICKPSQYGARVFTTDGGSVFHSRQDCPALMEGQQLVEDRHGEVAAVRAVAPGIAEESRRPCRTCW